MTGVGFSFLWLRSLASLSTFFLGTGILPCQPYNTDNDTVMPLRACPVRSGAGEAAEAQDAALDIIQEAWQEAADREEPLEAKIAEVKSLETAKAMLPLPDEELDLPSFMSDDEDVFADRIDEEDRLPGIPNAGFDGDFPF